MATRSTKLVSIDIFAESLVSNTENIRKALKAYVHFVPISFNVVAELFNGLDTTLEELNKIFSKVKYTFNSLYPNDGILGIDFNNLENYISKSGTRRLQGSKALGVYIDNTLVGLLTSNYANASELVVRVIQNSLGTTIPLAVGHTVGEVTSGFVHYDGDVIGGHSWIRNDLAFRSPLSMKLSVIAELFNLAESIENGNIDNIIDWYFEAPEGKSSAKRVAKRNFIILSDILYSSGKVFKGDLHKLHTSGYTNSISKSKLQEYLKTFSIDYFKIIKKKINTKAGREVTALELTSNIVKSINTIAEAHKKYYDKVMSDSLITKDFTDTLAKLKVIIALPQTQRFNSGELSKLETSIARNAFSIEFEHNKGSPSLIEHIENTIVNKLLGKPTRKFKQTKEAINGSLVVDYKKAVPKVTKRKIVTKVLKVNTTSTVRLRSVTGAFQSVSNLEALIRMSLYETIKSNMHSPALNFQTGRFAESVELKSISYDNRAGAVTAFLTYMKYPYATFEPGGDRGSIDRSPSSLIIRSVREIATKLTKARMQAIII